MSDLLAEAQKVRDAVQASADKRTKAIEKAQAAHSERVAETVATLPGGVFTLLHDYSANTCALIASALNLPHWPPLRKDPNE